VDRAPDFVSGNDDGFDGLVPKLDDVVDGVFEATGIGVGDGFKGHGDGIVDELLGDVATDFDVDGFADLVGDAVTYLGGCSTDSIM